MDDSTRWAKRTFYLAMIFGVPQTIASIASWLGWHPNWNLPPIPKGQFFLSGLCLISIALTWFFQRRGSARERPAKNLFDSPHFEIVAGKTFRNASIEIDGKSFRRCTFGNTKFLYRGIAPFDFDSECVFGDELELTTENQAIIQYMRIERVFKSFPGANVEQHATDQQGNRVTEKIRFRPLPPKTS